MAKKTRPRIVEAIEHFNSYVKPKDAKRMTKASLGLMVIKGMPPPRQQYYMTMWDNGKELVKMDVQHVERICDKTGVDANFLLDGCDHFITEKIQKKLKKLGIDNNMIFGIKPMKKLQIVSHE